MSELEAAVERLRNCPGLTVPEGSEIEALMTLANEYLRLTDLASRGEIDEIAKSLGIDLAEESK